MSVKHLGNIPLPNPYVTSGTENGNKMSIIHIIVYPNNLTAI